MFKLTFLTLFLFLLFPSFSWGNEVILSTNYSWTRTTITGQSNAPTYVGNGISGELEYLIPISDQHALSLFMTYLHSSQDNSANNAVVEKLKINYLGAGLKFSIGSFFTSASIGKLSFEDDISGTVTKKITADSIGYELGLGVRLRMTRLIGFTAAIQALNSNLSPEDGAGFYTKYGLWQVRGVLGFTFILPSLPFNDDNL